MSRSKRKPYADITGATNSAKQDKKAAHRGERRTQEQALRSARDFDNLLLPHRSECPDNNVWG